VYIEYVHANYEIPNQHVSKVESYKSRVELLFFLGPFFYFVFKSDLCFKKIPVLFLYCPCAW